MLEGLSFKAVDGDGNIVAVMISGVCPLKEVRITAHYALRIQQDKGTKRVVQVTLALDYLIGIRTYTQIENRKFVKNKSKYNNVILFLDFTILMA